MKEDKNETDKDRQKDHNFVEVAVVTTSGSYPADGFDKTPVHQKIRVILEQATKKLKITDTTGWVALHGDVELNVEANYLESGLSGEVEIDFGPREGGGGDA